MLWIVVLCVRSMLSLVFSDRFVWSCFVGGVVVVCCGLWWWGVCVIVVVFVGVIGLYVRALFSVIASSTGGLSATAAASSSPASSISCSPLTYLNDS